MYVLIDANFNQKLRGEWHLLDVFVSAAFAVSAVYV